MARFYNSVFPGAIKYAEEKGVDYTDAVEHLDVEIWNELKKRAEAGYTPILMTGSVDTGVVIVYEEK